METPSIEVQLLPAAAGDDAPLMQRITELTNEVALPRVR
jgi:hypothetical protein